MTSTNTVLKESKILIIQSAFIGDVVLTLPLVQQLSKTFPHFSIDVIVIPRSAEVLRNHPAINNIIIYDKYGIDKGIKGFLRLLKFIKSEHYEIAFIPHRSFRSALLAYLGKIKRRIGFNKSVGKILYTDIVKYEKGNHEIGRNLSLLKPISKVKIIKEPPLLYPTSADIVFINKILFEEEILDTSKLIGVAPGSVWNTKRWTKEGYFQLIKKLVSMNFILCLIGGKDDVVLCEEIVSAIGTGRVFSTAGKLSLLQSAELIKRCKILVSNDSAPIHIAAAVGTPVVAIFGPTVPAFGFAPIGKLDSVIETLNLKCRPCAIHGGKKCPIGTFECMLKIKHELVYDKIMEVYHKSMEMRYQEL